MHCFSQKKHTCVFYAKSPSQVLSYIQIPTEYTQILPHPADNINKTPRRIQMVVIKYDQIYIWQKGANSGDVHQLLQNLKPILRSLPKAANHEREFPIPGIPGNTGLQFPSRKSGMEFSTPIPVPEKGNGIFITVPVPENWEWN